MKENYRKPVIITGVIAVLIAVYFVVKHYKIVKDNKDETPKQQDEQVLDNTDVSALDVTKSPQETESSIVLFNKAISDAQRAFLDKNYEKSITYYNQALQYNNSDVVYAGLYTNYTAQGNWTKALESINKALDLKKDFTDYWKWKISLLDEKTNASFSDLKEIYEKGMKVANSTTKINLVVYFARVAENNQQKEEAVTLWKQAIVLNPNMKTVYQTEIDNLQSNN